MKNRASLLFLLLILAACDSTRIDDRAAAPSVLRFENIEAAEGFVVPTPGTEVIRTQAAWRTLWNAAWDITNGDGTKTPPPAVNFTRKMVIGIAWGQRSSGCSNGVQSVQTVIQREGEIVVLVGPLPDLGPCDAVVHPIQMIQIDRSDLPVVFEGIVPGS